MPPIRSQTEDIRQRLLAREQKKPQKKSGKKKGLWRDQKAALRVLSSGKWYTRRQIHELGGNCCTYTGTLGKVRPGEKADWGYPSLQDLGYVRLRVVDVCGETEYLFQITQAGIDAINRGEAN